MARLLVTALLLAGCDSDVGAACSEDDDCESGICFTKVSPGYCTMVCSTEGSQSECTDSTVCKKLEGDQYRCLTICSEEADCADNANCNGVPGSTLKACEPVAP